MNKICFIVGHGKSKNGGYDSGAVSKDGKFHEFQIAKKIAKYAQTYYNSTYTEQADCMNYDGDVYLADRIDRANSAGYDFIAEIHLNAGGGTGTECYYHHGNRKGQKYADKICDYISADLDIKQRASYGDDRAFDTDKDGGDKTKLNSSGSDYFGIIRQTKATAVLIETVFIDTASDLAKVNTLDGQKKCGVAIAKAVAKVRGAKKKTATTTNKKPTTAPATESGASTATKKESFLPARGYFKKGDKGENVEKINAFYYRVFPSYAKALNRNKENVKGDLFGENSVAWTKEFQRRTGLEVDGYFGPLTLAELKKYGFKE